MVITDSDERAVTIINPWQQQSLCARLSFVLLTSSDGDDNDISSFSPLKMYPPENQGKKCLLFTFLFFFVISYLFDLKNTFLFYFTAGPL